ncbi:Rho GTPase activation protein [Entophlyctis helioformis]|nr:Rho GTPase activation protein [Entophlyctis helioformis]
MAASSASATAPAPSPSPTPTAAGADRAASIADSDPFRSGASELTDTDHPKDKELLLDDDSDHARGSRDYLGSADNLGEGDDNGDDEDDDNDWHMVTTEDGQVYYWNAATGETSWDAPFGDTPADSLDQLAIDDKDGDDEHGDQLGDSMRVVDAPLSPSKGGNLPVHDQQHESMRLTSALARIDMVLPELIRREGWLGYKVRKEFGGIEPKKAHSWHNHWAIVVVGFLIFFKDDPIKLKKKSERTPVAPTLVITLESITLSRDKDAATAKKKSSGASFTLQTRSGAVWALQPQSEADINEWVSTISEATREASTPAEYENVTTKLFAKQDAEATTPGGSSVSARGAKKSDEKRLAKADSKKKERPSISNADSGTEDGDSSNKVKIKSKLNAFFKRQQEKGPIPDKEKDTVSDDAIFGGLLDVQSVKEGRAIPLFVEKCITAIDQRGLKSQGIYRLSGNAASIQRIRTLVNQNNYTELDDENIDLNAVSGLLKLYFRELKDPLIPFEFYDRFIACMKIEEYNDRLIEIKTLVQSLPKVHYDVLEYLMRHLVRVASHSDVNKMEPSNLAIVFGPTIIRVPSNGNDDMHAAYANMMNMSFQNALVEAIVVQTEWIFDGSPH